MIWPTRTLRAAAFPGVLRLLALLESTPLRPRTPLAWLLLTAGALAAVPASDGRGARLDREPLARRVDARTAGRLCSPLRAAYLALRSVLLLALLWLVLSLAAAHLSGVTEFFARHFTIGGRAPQGGPAAGAMPPSRRMADGRQWTTRNLDIVVDSSYCYGGVEANCRRYGRLYTWDAARHACQSLGAGWRLPTNDEWRELARAYGGLLEESEARGHAAFVALTPNGSSGFDALLGGGRAHDTGEYARLDAHGLYWTASASDADHAWLYNFGRGMQSVNRHRDGEKLRALSVRCVKD